MKKEVLAQVCSCEFCEISKNTFFPEHLRESASENQIRTIKYGDETTITNTLLLFTLLLFNLNRIPLKTREAMNVLAVAENKLVPIRSKTC